MNDAGQGGTGVRSSMGKRKDRKAGEEKERQDERRGEESEE